MARIAICSFSPSPSLSPAAPNPSRRLPLVPLPLRLKFSRNWIGGRRPLAAVVARYGGGGGYRPGPSRRRPRDGRAAADPDYDPALDLDRIKSPSVRLLDEQQNMLGVVSIDEAVRMADDADLILAILSIDADPPVLRLFESTDYKKHKFEQQKKKRVQQKRSAANRIDIKELKMGYNIDSHDYSVRLKAARKFLKDGDKVKVIVNLKGRENEFRNIAIELLQRFQSDIGEWRLPPVPSTTSSFTGSSDVFIQWQRLPLTVAATSSSGNNGGSFPFLPEYLSLFSASLRPPTSALFTAAPRLPPPPSSRPCHNPLSPVNSSCLL